MEKRPLFPGSSIEVSVAGLGCAGLGGCYGEQEESRKLETVHTALREGVNFFDVAPFYGGTASETVLGKALQCASGYARSSYCIATKVGRYAIEGSTSGAGGNFDFSAKKTEESVKESMARLQTDHIDLIQCHDIEYTDVKTLREQTLPYLEHLRATGKVSAVGITGYPLGMFREVIESYGDEKLPFNTILSYAHLTLQNDLLLKEIPLYQSKGLGVLTASPLALGLLTPDGPPDWHASTKECISSAREAAAWCKDNNVNIAELGMQYVFSHKDLSSIIMGAITPEQVKMNLGTMNAAPNQEAVAKIREIFSSHHNEMFPAQAGTFPVYKW